VASTTGPDASGSYDAAAERETGAVAGMLRVEPPSMMATRSWFVTVITRRLCEACPETILSDDDLRG
jgi:hypothetical protein